MKIGILGGTFDPIHNGHLDLAEAAIESLELDEVVFIPAARNPLKKRGAASQKQRLEMVQIAIKDQPQYLVSDIELSRGGASYMVDTLMELQYVKPGDYWLLMGTDSLRTFSEWKNYLKILRLCRLGVAMRPPQTQTEVETYVDPEILSKVDWIKMEPSEVSSTGIRHRLEEGKVTSHWMPASVSSYIRENKLY